MFPLGILWHSLVVLLLGLAAILTSFWDPLDDLDGTGGKL